MGSEGMYGARIGVVGRAGGLWEVRCYTGKG